MLISDTSEVTLLEGMLLPWERDAAASGALETHSVLAS